MAVDGVIHPVAIVDVALEGEKTKKKKKPSSFSCTFNSFTFFGLLAYFFILWGFYAGHFTMLYEIALAARGHNYVRLSHRQSGHTVAVGSYQMPWEILAAV